MKNLWLGRLLDPSQKPRQSASATLHYRCIQNHHYHRLHGHQHIIGYVSFTLFNRVVMQRAVQDTTGDKFYPWWWDLSAGSNYFVSTLRIHCNTNDLMISSTTLRLTAAHHNLLRIHCTPTISFLHVSWYTSLLCTTGLPFQFSRAWNVLLAITSSQGTIPLCTWPHGLYI